MGKLIIRLQSLVLILAFLAVPVSVMGQDITVIRTFAAPGVSTRQTILNNRITFSRVTWVLDGTITACAFTVEKSLDGVLWTSVAPLQDCTSSGEFEVVTALLGKFIRFNVSALAGGGTLRIVLDGFRGSGCGVDYRGIFSVVPISDPASGTELTVTVPATERWRAYSAYFELDTSNVVGDREVFLVVSSEGIKYFQVFADGVVKADQKGIFTAAALGFVGTAGLGPASINQPADVRTILIPIYSEAFIPGGHAVSTETNGLQAGDDYSSGAILVERCPN